MDRVFIEGLEVDTVIGAYDWERGIRQCLRILSLGLVRSGQMGELSVEAAPLDTLRAALLHLDIPEDSNLAGTFVTELPLPTGAVVSLVVRGGRTIDPDRNTRLRAGDRMLIVTTDPARDATERALQSVSRSGRLGDWIDRSPQSE